LCVRNDFNVLAGLKDVSIEAIDEVGVCLDRILERVIRNRRRTLRGNEDHEGRGRLKDFGDVLSLVAANGLIAIIGAHVRVD